MITMNGPAPGAPLIDLGEIGGAARAVPRRRARDPLILVAAAVVAAALLLAGGRLGQTDMPGGGTQDLPAAPAARPRLVAPHAVSAGESIPVLAYRYRGRCGATELRLDGAPVAHRLARYAGSADTRWMEVFLILDVPAGAAVGRHELGLFFAGCGGTLHRLAAITITVSVAAGHQGTASLGVAAGAHREP
jgi:hypothetical protein